MNFLFEILFEDADLLVVNKPAGLVCHPTKGDEYSSLISRARLYQPGGSLHLVNRLDRETSGVLVIAKNSAAAGELGKSWESRAVEKEYLALVHGWPAADTGVLDGPLGKDVNSTVAVKDCVRPDHVAARGDGLKAAMAPPLDRRHQQPQQPEHDEVSGQRRLPAEAGCRTRPYPPEGRRRCPLRGALREVPRLYLRRGKPRPRRDEGRPQAPRQRGAT